MSSGDQSAQPKPTTPSKTAVTSTNLKCLLHRADGRIEIEFLNSPAIYITEIAVSQEVYNDWLIAESIGGYFNQHIVPYYRPRLKKPEDDQPPSEQPKPMRLTEEEILTYTIAVDINRWLHELDDEARRSLDLTDRTMKISQLIKDRSLPHAHSLVAEALKKGDERLVEGGRICFKIIQ